jgi:hypothetical protein
MGIGKIETRDKGWGHCLRAGGEAIASGEKNGGVSLRKNTAK